MNQICIKWKSSPKIYAVMNFQKQKNMNKRKAVEIQAVTLHI